MNWFVIGVNTRGFQIDNLILNFRRARRVNWMWMYLKGQLESHLINDYCKDATKFMFRVYNKGYIETSKDIGNLAVIKERTN